MLDFVILTHLLTHSYKESVSINIFLLILIVLTDLIKFTKTTKDIS